MDPHSAVIAQRFDAGSIDGGLVVLIRGRQPGRTFYLIWHQGKVGELARDDEGAIRQVLGLERNPALTQQLRTRCEGARILWAGGLYFEREDACFALSADGVLKPIDSPLESQPISDVLTPGDSIATALLEGRLEGQRSRLGRALRSTLERLTRRARAVLGDIEKMDRSIDDSRRAQMFVSASVKAPRGTRELIANDWETGETISFAVPPDVAPRQALERVFKKAKRLREGRQLADERIQATELTVNLLNQLLQELAAATSVEAMARVEAIARAKAPRDFRFGSTSTKKSLPQAKALPCRLFQSARGKPLWVGRNALGNDAMLQLAQPYDAWLHAKDRTGSHVIVPLERGKTCPPDVLIEAAHLAAHFSDARDDAVVDVQHSTKRYLRKPKGAAPGFVVVTQEKVIALRVDAERLKALLETERTTDDLRTPPRE